MTALRFTGDWSVWAVLALALGLAALAWRLYRGQVRGRTGVIEHLLPWLRAAAVFLAVMMLAGPVLHHRQVIGDLLQLRVIVDASASLDRTDPSLPVGRRVRIAQALGLFGGAVPEIAVAAAADRLEAAAEAAAAGDAERFRTAVDAAAKRVAELPADAVRGMLQPGSIALELWKNVQGKTLDTLTNHPSFAGAPSETIALPDFAWNGRGEDQYGGRIRGWLQPPASGDYIFWISSDDQSALWLSRDDAPANKQRLAGVPDWVAAGAWDAEAAQKSAPVRLEAGRWYYIEALVKEEFSSDHLAVGWTRPDGTVERPIPGAFLAPFAAGGEGGMSGAWRDDLDRALFAPARTLGREGAADPAEAARNLAGLGLVAARWADLLHGAFDRTMARRLDAGDTALQTAVDRVDRTTRWQRMQALLLEGPDPLLGRLADRHEVQLQVVKEGQLEHRWNARAGRYDDRAELPSSLGAAADGRFTDLAAALAAEPPVKTGGPRRAVLLLSDGAVNAGASPAAEARVLGAGGIPVFTACFGAEIPPVDVAVVSVETPRTVFFRDRLMGRVVLDDRAPAGRPFTLRIRTGGETVWEQTLNTVQAGLRQVVFDVPVEGLVSNLLAGADAGLERRGLPIEFSAEIDAPEGDAEPRNDRRGFDVFAALRKHRVLLLDGGPRWEWRYVKNLFDRDPQWDLVSPASWDIPMPRGKGREDFPASRKELFDFDLVVLGELEPSRLRAEDWEALRAFVRDRGGGMILVDGPRGALRKLSGGPLGPVAPAEWLDAEPLAMTERLALTEAGRGLDAFDLGQDAAGISRWQKLPPPHRVLRVQPAPGAEVLVEAVSGETRAPAMIRRRYGAGQVLYFAFDETWRWRREAADRDHRRFWNQAALWVMEEPFAVSDGRVSVDAGAAAYRPGETAQLRVRVRDAEGRILPAARATALLFRDGQRLTALPLLPDDRESGVLRARSAPLEEGRYEVRVRLEDEGSTESRAAAQFRVAPPETGELAAPAARPEVLRKIAQETGGVYVPEERLEDVADALVPLVQGRVIERETVLWQRYPWFAVLVLLLTAEWILRRRKGML